MAAESRAIVIKNGACVSRSELLLPSVKLSMVHRIHNFDEPSSRNVGLEYGFAPLFQVSEIARFVDGLHRRRRWSQPWRRVKVEELGHVDLSGVSRCQARQVEASLNEFH